MIINPNVNKFSFKPNYISSLFDESATLPGVLKNPNQLKEAFIYDYISHKDPVKIYEFINSKEAKAMIEAGTITYDTLDKLSQKADDKKCGMNVAVCHVAKENNDELWDELIKARAEERRIMNELLSKYGNEVSPILDKAHEEIINSIPNAFK